VAPEAEGVLHCKIRWHHEDTMRFLIRCVALLALAPASVLAGPRFDCPPEPAAIAHGPTDVRAGIRASATEMGHVATAQIEARLRARYPRIAPDVLEQALHAAYCQRLAAQAELSDEQRFTRFRSLHTATELEQVAPRGTAVPVEAPPAATIRSLHTTTEVETTSRRAAVAADTGSATVTRSMKVDMAAPSAQAGETRGAGPDLSARSGGGGAVPRSSAGPKIPEFPWPPPPPSASRVIGGGVLTARIKDIEARTHKVLAVHGRYHLRDVDAILRRSLRATGYEFRYYGAPRGFATVARLERIDDKGAPFPTEERFDSEFRPVDGFSLMGYLRALFVAPPGHYRVIVFIVSPEPFQATGKPVSSEEASAWLEGGVNVLPKEIGGLEYTLPDYACTALIYEFDKRDTQSNPVELHPGRLSADTHLESSGIAKLLWNRPSP
jgi:hypothetical protein